MKRSLFLITTVTIVLAAACSTQAKTQKPVELRLGYFPNITHAQALVGVANGTFEAALQPEYTLKTYVFNAGPSVIEALFAGELDLAYIGPNPAVNGYVKSQGMALRIVAGAASGGAVLVVRAGTDIHALGDLVGKRVATPQLGNTQDVALRYRLQEQGITLNRLTISPMQNADILTAFLKGEIDAAWVPEPWGARLVREAGGTVALDERTLWPDGRFATAVVIASTKVLQQHPDAVKRFLAAHVHVTRWIQQHPDETKQAVNDQILKLTGKRLADAVLDDAWARLEFTADSLTAPLLAAADHAFAVGFLGAAKPDLSRLHDVTLLPQAAPANAGPQTR